MKNLSLICVPNSRCGLSWRIAHWAPTGLPNNLRLTKLWKVVSIQLEVGGYRERRNISPQKKEERRVSCVRPPPYSRLPPNTWNCSKLKKKEKHNKKTFLKKKTEKEPNFQDEVEAQKEVAVFSSAALSSLKVSKKSKYALSARSGLADKRLPPKDNNLWKTLIASRQGYTHSAKILARVLTLLRRKGSVSHSGPADLSPYQKALWAIFAAERPNSYRAIENRRGTPAFTVTEVSNILFLCGRKMADDPTSEQPSIHNQDSHYLLQDKEESRFMVPILGPHSAVGVAVAQQIHDETCGSSPGTALARASRYYYFCPPAGNLFKGLQENCFKCRRIRMIRGRDLINPLRHLSHTSMIPGLLLQIDVGGPWTVFTKSKQSILETGEEKRTKRTTTKIWLLLAIDYFTSRLDVSPLENMSTGALSRAIQDIT